MSVTVGHLRVSDVTLCSTCCGCSSVDAFEPTMSVTVGHIKVADVTEEFARTCALVSWKNLRAYVLLTQLN